MEETETETETTAEKETERNGGGNGENLYVAMINPHGLLRGRDLELGIDADTGGQTLYVLQLAKALAKLPAIGRVDIFTRLIKDDAVSDAYRVVEEPVSDKAFIQRIDFGPPRHLRKELLWNHLDSFADKILPRFRTIGRIPDLIHAHYADAGYTGSNLASLLGVPLIFTGHSLGISKLQRLMDGGMSRETIERRFKISRRIEAEELTLEAASLVITSTRQEVEEQYGDYDHYDPSRMRVIPPGVDISNYYPPTGRGRNGDLDRALKRFLNNPDKPIVLTISRADERKNLEALVQAFGEDEELRDLANLVLIAGSRQDIEELDEGSRTVIKRILMLIDKYDLYGHVAYPKTIPRESIPDMYRLAARRRGVFVNPAFTEPFGLTLLEAAASGLPIVATEDGGPNDIIANCGNGYLIDPLNPEAIAKAIRNVLTDRQKWKQFSRAGLRGVRKHYTWEAHARRYLQEVRARVGGRTLGDMISDVRSRRTNLPLIRRMIITDVDELEPAEEDVMQRFRELLAGEKMKFGFGIATGRDLKSTLRELEERRLPAPDFILASLGTEIFYGKKHRPDYDWQQHIAMHWNRAAVVNCLEDVPGLYVQEGEDKQRPFKVSYDINLEEAPKPAVIRQRLREHQLKVRATFSHGAFLDILPIRANKGMAMRYLGWKWGIPPEHMLVVGYSGSDESVLLGETLGVVPAGHSKELGKLRDSPRIYFSDQPGLAGVLDGLMHYRMTEPASSRGDVDRSAA